MACNEQKEKQELLRIVKSKDGIIEVDLTGKKSDLSEASRDGNIKTG